MVISNAKVEGLHQLMSRPHSLTDRPWGLAREEGDGGEEGLAVFVKHQQAIVKAKDLGFLCQILKCLWVIENVFGVVRIAHVIV